MANTAISPSPGALTLIGYAPLVAQSYSIGGVAPLASTLLTLFPSQGVQVLNAGGTMANEWYRALRFERDILTDGVNAIPVSVIIETINTARSNLERLNALTAALQQQAHLNAESNAKVIEVVKLAALSGAESIPPVQQVIESSPDGGGE